MPALLAWTLGVWGAADLSLWRDEAITSGVARRSVGGIFHLLGDIDAVHGAYYLLIHGVIQVFGDSPFALRLPSIVAFGVAAGGIAVIGRRLVSPTCGLIAGLLYAGSPFASRYAHEARSYALITALAVLVTLLFLRLVDSRGRGGVAYAAGLVCLGLFHLFTLLIVAAHLASLLLIRRDRRVVRRWFIAVAGAGAVLSPLVMIAASQRDVLSRFPRPGWDEVTALAWAFTGTPPMALLLGLGALAGALGTADVRSVALPWLVLPTAILLVVSQISPCYQGRYVIWTLPALSLLAAAGFVRLPWRAWLIPLILLGALSVPLQLDQRRPERWPDRLDQAAEVLREQARPADAIVFIPVGRRAVAEAYPDPYQRLRDVNLLRTATQEGNFGGSEVDEAEVRRRMLDPTVRRVWLLEGAPVWRTGLDGQNQAKLDTLGRGYHQVQQWNFKGLTLSLYER